MTAAMSGVVPKNLRSGAKVPSNKMSEKKPAPVSASTVGVTSAAVVQPNFWKMNRPKIIMTRVAEPVAVLKLPCGVYMVRYSKQAMDSARKESTP